MNQFQICANDYLPTNVTAFFHVPYTGMGNPGNPDYLNHLKNTFNDFPKEKLDSAVLELKNALLADLPEIVRSLNSEAVACVVPRAKAESSYHANQQLFRTTVQSVVSHISGLEDGTNYLRRHTNTRTTHLRNPVRNYLNDGREPYPGILEETCDISPNVDGRHILLIDDIYTPSVNVDEDAIAALLRAGARTVAFYAVGKV